tara:strand:- start:9836 stop:10969 length:1134 start_codon:yes stop_codon:yes gene_type:complete
LLSKILIINSSSPIDLVGGTQSSLKYVIENLKEKNYEVSFISWSYKKNEVGFYNLKQFNGLRLPDIRKNILLFYIFIFKNYYQIKELFNVDIVWIHSPLPWFFITKFLKKSSKLIYTIHGPLKKELSFSKSKIKFIKIFISNIILKKCVSESNLIHCNSNYVYEESLSESNFLLSKKKIILELLLDNYLFYENIINLSKSNKIKKLNFLEKKFFLICRRLVKRTGVLEFIKLINQDKFFEDFLFVVTGDGPLKSQISKLTKNNVIYLGEIDDTSVNFLKYKAFCYIIPSIEAEGYSLLAKEAIVLNKFVIHTNQGGLKESLTNYSKSKIFELNNIDSLKKIFNGFTKDFSKNSLLTSSNNHNKKEFKRKLEVLFDSL